MIIGIFLRNIKIYSNTNYIPISNGDTFSGFVGNNGIGKSSILEALDCFFNGRDWIFSTSTKKQGKKAKPHIVPVYLLNHDFFSDRSEKEREFAREISNRAWNVHAADLNSSNHQHFNIFENQRQELIEFKEKEYYLLPVGLSNESNSLLSNLSIFEGIIDKKEDSVPQFKKSLDTLHETIKTKLDYIYIPKEIDPKEFTQLETREIQVLMGETLINIIKEKIKDKQIKEINDGLDEFLKDLSSKLGEYEFRTLNNRERQKKISRTDINKLITESYFSKRSLHKKQGSSWLELKDLSSGEKQKAIVELAHHLLRSCRKDASYMILAIDEPESSLHVSACYEQFGKLLDISHSCHQVLFTTHWYGFMPAMENGHVTAISTDNEGQHKFDLIDLDRQREIIKQNVASSKGKFPYDVRLKSINDFIQSIVSSLFCEEPYNWIICEGSSERIYLQAYLQDLRSTKKLRVIPVGGAREVRKIYNNLKVALEDIKDEIGGKVFLISDTDTQFFEWDTDSRLDRVLQCKRIINDVNTKTTGLVDIGSNLRSPNTEIEDVLDGEIFFETLDEFREEEDFISEILENRNPEEYKGTPSFFALNLGPLDKEKLDNFFDKKNNKFDFANKYVENIKNIGDSLPLPWISEIEKFFNT